MYPAKKSRAGTRKPAYHHGDLRTALMAAALPLIDRHGVKGFTLKDAATQAGVSTAAPYRHFADKESLLRAIQGEGFALFNTALAAAYESAPATGARIEELGVAYVLFALEHPAHFRVMFGLGGGDDKSRPQHDEPTGFLLLHAGVAALHPMASQEFRNDMVIGCWSVVHGFAMLQMEGAFHATNSFPSVEQQLRRTLRLVLGNITAG